MQKSETEKVKTSQAEGIPIHCSGDGQFDSPGKLLKTNKYWYYILCFIPPGHTASFCTYTIQNLANNAVLAIYVAHKHQVWNNTDYYKN